MKLPRLFLAVLAILAVFLLTPSVQASFPGANGRIVFVSLRDDPIGDIYTMDPDGTNLTRLTNNSVYDDVPVWSPNMTKIAFIRTVGAASDIFVMNADGTNQMNLTSHAAHDTYPAWSPDGTKIVFSSDRDTVEGLYELYTMNAADGTNVTRLTNNSAYDDTADWSPDGTKIAFQSFRDSNYEVYVMNADGTNQTNCTSTKENGSSWIFEPCLTWANALRRVQHPAFSLVTQRVMAYQAGHRMERGLLFIANVITIKKSM